MMSGNTAGASSCPRSKWRTALKTSVLRLIVHFDLARVRVDDPVLVHVAFGVERRLRFPVVGERRFSDLDEQKRAVRVLIFVATWRNEREVRLRLRVVRRREGQLDPHRRAIAERQNEVTIQEVDGIAVGNADGAPFRRPVLG